MTLHKSSPVRLLPLTAIIVAYGLLIVACSASAPAPSFAQVNEFRAPPQIAFVFSINMTSTKESQKYPFRNRLVYNYSPNPDLRFIEGKTFSEEEARQAIKYMFEFSKVHKLHAKDWFTLADKIWLNTPAEQVVTEAAELGIHTLVFLNLQSCALVQAINQQKTLFLYSNDKPEQTTVYDYFYNLKGKVALINVEHRKILFQKTLGGIDYLSPRETKVASKEELFSKTVRKVGDKLYEVIKEQHEIALTWKPSEE